MRVQMEKLMETIQAIARGLEIMVKMQEEINQRDNITTPISTVNPPIMKNHVPPLGNILVHIPVGASDDVPPPVLNPLVVEIDDQQDAFFILRVASMYDAFGPATN